MYDHIGLKVKDLEVAVRFYRAALEPLGTSSALQDASSPASGRRMRRHYGSTDEECGECGDNIAFLAADRSAVDRFHAAA